MYFFPGYSKRADFGSEIGRLGKFGVCSVNIEEHRPRRPGMGPDPFVGEDARAPCQGLMR